MVQIEIKVDFHVHTNASHDGVSSLEKQAKAARKRGLSAIAITDHNLCTITEPREIEGVLLIPGCEISTTRGHMTALFLKKPLDIEALTQNGLPTPESAAQEAHRCGGVAVMAHPFYKQGVKLDDFAACLDGAEAENARAYYKNPAASEQAREYINRFSLLTCAGSDAHTSGEVGNAYMLLSCEAVSIEEIEAAFKLGGTAVVKRRTKRRYKGISQLYKRARTGKIPDLVIGLAYLGYSIFYDIGEAVKRLFR